MDALVTSGRFFFAFVILGFAIEHFVFGHSLSTLILFPANTPYLLVWVYAIGIVFVVAGASLAAN